MAHSLSSLRNLGQPTPRLAPATEPTPPIQLHPPCAKAAQGVHTRCMGSGESTAARSVHGAVIPDTSRKVLVLARRGRGRGTRSIVSAADARRAYLSEKTCRPTKSPSEAGPGRDARKVLVIDREQVHCQIMVAAEVDAWPPWLGGSGSQMSARQEKCSGGPEPGGLQMTK